MVEGKRGRNKHGRKDKIWRSQGKGKKRGREIQEEEGRKVEWRGEGRTKIEERTLVEKSMEESWKGALKRLGEKRRENREW